MSSPEASQPSPAENPFGDTLKGVVTTLANALEEAHLNFQRINTDHLALQKRVADLEDTLQKLQANVERGFRAR